MGRPFLLRDAIYEPNRKLNLYFYTLCARRTCLVYFSTYISLSISISASLYLCFTLSLSLSLSFSLSSDMHYFHGQNRFLLLNYSYQMQMTFFFFPRIYVDNIWPINRIRAHLWVTEDIFKIPDNIFKVYTCVFENETMNI